VKRANVILSLSALAILGGLFYLYGGHKTPRNQAPLADLNAANLNAFKDEFNRTQADIRILLLLSPT
jgi:hypothetical protein